MNHRPEWQKWKERNQREEKEEIGGKNGEQIGRQHFNRDSLEGRN